MVEFYSYIVWRGPGWYRQEQQENPRWYGGASVNPETISPNAGLGWRYFATPADWDVEYVELPYGMGPLNRHVKVERVMRGDFGNYRDIR